MERRTHSLIGVFCLQLHGALHTYHGTGAKCYQRRMVPVCTLLLLTLYQSQCQRQDEIQVLNLSRSSVWNCTQYGFSAFSKYSVMILFIHGKFIQLNFPAAEMMTLLDFLMGAYSDDGLTTLIVTFLCCSIQTVFCSLYPFTLRYIPLSEFLVHAY